MRRTYPPMPKMEDRLERAGTRPFAIHKPNVEGARHGVPKPLRRYATRYGKGLDDLVSMHLKFPVEKL